MNFFMVGVGMEYQESPINPSSDLTPAPPTIAVAYDLLLGIATRTLKLQPQVAEQSEWYTTYGKAPGQRTIHAKIPLSPNRQADIKALLFDNVDQNRLRLTIHDFRTSRSVLLRLSRLGVHRLITPELVSETGYHIFNIDRPTNMHTRAEHTARRYLVAASQMLHQYISAPSHDSLLKPDKRAEGAKWV